jgi:V/A-type H+-transporting ATPase subunit C
MTAVSRRLESTGPALGSGVTGYAYANARIRGMRSRLLTRAELDALVGMTDLTQIIQGLEGTEYGPDVDAAVLQGRTPTNVDDGLKASMVRVHRKVLGFLAEESYDILTALLGRWDVFNLKTVLRGKHMHLDAAEIEEGMVAAGQLAESDLEELAKLPDVKAVVDTLVTWGVPYARVLSRTYPEYRVSEDLSSMELALDRYYFEWAGQQLKGPGSNKKAGRQVMGVQADVTNLLTVFRAIKADLSGVDVSTFFLRGGLYIHEREFVELLALSDIDQVLDRVTRTPYGRALDEASLAYLEEGAISTLERALEEVLIRRAVALGSVDPFGVGIAISYLWAKQNEVTNLRIIVRGVAAGLPEDRMRRELILV